LGVGAILLIVILLLLIVTTVFFIFNQKRFKESLKAIGIEDTEIITDNTDKTENANENDAVPQLDSPIYNKDGDRIADLENEDLNNAEDNDTILNPKQQKNDKWKLARPCWVVSFGSFTKEQTANSETNRLKSLGYSAGYYWIPDYRNKGSKELYKVYVGPFTKKSEAKKLLPTIKKLSHFKDAYILKVN